MGYAGLYSRDVTLDAEEESLEDWKGSLAILAAGPAAGREAALLKLGDRLWTASGEVSLSTDYRFQTFEWKQAANSFKNDGHHLPFVMSCPAEKPIPTTLTVCR